MMSQISATMPMKNPGWLALCVLCVLLVACTGAPDRRQNDTLSPAQSALKDKALAGDREAQFQLGTSFCCGDSGTFDTGEAIRWWCLAALQNHPGALSALKKHDRRKTCPI